MKRYLFLFALILIVGLASNAQALLFTFSGSDLGGTGTATMDISIDGYTLTALIENTSPTTLDDDDVLGVNSPGITAFGFDLVDLDMFVLGWWELTAVDPTLFISEDSLIVRMQNVGLDGEGSLKLTGAVPEPSTMLLLGFGLVGLAAVGRKRIH